MKKNKKETKVSKPAKKVEVTPILVKLTKKMRVKSYLQRNGSITPWEAIEKFGATRLAAIIHGFRKEGMLIDTKEVNTKDRFGNDCHYANYVLRTKLKKKKK